MHRVASVLIASSLLTGCGNLFDCYDAKLLGTAGHNLTLVLKDGRRRETHTTADAGTIMRIAEWKAGDELVVCNATITNKTKGEGARCGDFGCLAIWP